jgi:hypothetical protein
VRGGGGSGEEAGSQFLGGTMAGRVADARAAPGGGQVAAAVTKVASLSS